MYQWCERNGVAFTGHYWDHEWPHCNGVPDNLAMAAWQQIIPGIDCLNEPIPGNHPTPNSATLPHGPRTQQRRQPARTHPPHLRNLRAGGWDLRFEDMKRIADWLACWG